MAHFAPAQKVRCDTRNLRDEARIRCFANRHIFTRKKRSHEYRRIDQEDALLHRVRGTEQNVKDPLDGIKNILGPEIHQTGNGLESKKKGRVDFLQSDCRREAAGSIVETCGRRLVADGTTHDFQVGKVGGVGSLLSDPLK